MPISAQTSSSGAIRRSARDATGHLDPQYARDLHEKSLENHEDQADRAFLGTKSSAHEELAEKLGEEAVGAMTSGEDQGESLLEEETEGERGGPFVETEGSDEFANGVDESNPPDATREPFPRV